MADDRRKSQPPCQLLLSCLARAAMIRCAQTGSRQTTKESLIHRISRCYTCLGMCSNDLVGPRYSQLEGGEIAPAAAAAAAAAATGKTSATWGIVYEGILTFFIGLIIITGVFKCLRWFSVAEICFIPNIHTAQVATVMTSQPQATGWTREKNNR